MAAQVSATGQLTIKLKTCFGSTVLITTQNSGNINGCIQDERGVF